MTNDVAAVIKQQITENKIVLYMKGTPQMPQCGFSAQVVKVLSLCGISNKDFLAIDVLADAAIRQGIKEYSQWPTIPQLYISGEFIGGCDIVNEMYQNQELQALL